MKAKLTDEGVLCARGLMVPLVDFFFFSQGPRLLKKMRLLEFGCWCTKMTGRLWWEGSCPHRGRQKSGAQEYSVRTEQNDSLCQIVRSNYQIIAFQCLPASLCHGIESDIATNSWIQHQKENLDHFFFLFKSLWILKDWILSSLFCTLHNDRKSPVGNFTAQAVVLTFVCAVLLWTHGGRRWKICKLKCSVDIFGLSGSFMCAWIVCKQGQLQCSICTW